MIKVTKVGVFGFEKGIKIMPAVKQKTAILISNEAVNFFKANFDKEGFLDRSVQKWKRSERATRDSGRTLTDTSDLKNSIAPIKTSWRRSVLVAKEDYGIFHNEGIGKQPKRKFMGNSMILTKKMERIIRRNFKKVI